MLLLTVRTGASPQPHPLREGLVVVGRALDCDIVVNHESVSRHHAQFTIAGEDARVVDLNSSSGLFCNGQRVREARVAAGDVLGFGSVEAQIEHSREWPREGIREAGPPSGLDLEHTVYRRLGSLARDGAPAVDANRVIRLLGEIGRTLVAPLSLDETLERVVTLLMANVPADRAMLAMRGPDGSAFVPAVTRARQGSTAPAAFAVSRTVTDLVVRERVALLTADARHDERFELAQSLYRDEVRSLMCAPLGYLSDSSVMGLLYVDNSWNHQFSVADLELFTALADYASVAVSQARLGDELKREARRRERLSRYHSPAVVDLVLHDRSSESIAGEERDVTVVFADLVQFTTLAENMSPTDVVRILNAFFTSMTDIVFAHQGTVDKFIGDAILVIFGAPLDQSDHATRALETAQAMQLAVAELNRRQLAPRPLSIRVAVHSGPAIVGDIGSPARLEYTVVGDVVNTAARLQSEVAAPDQIVISRATIDRLPIAPPVESLGAIKVRGRGGLVEAFRLITRPG